MEAMLGISLCSYLYLKLAKTLSFLLSLMSSPTKLEKRAEQICLEASGGRRRCGGLGGEMAQTMYAHMNK
jgi:hypothetical protein